MNEISPKKLKTPENTPPNTTTSRETKCFGIPARVGVTYNDRLLIEESVRKFTSKFR